jgi:hypothetical protein
MAGQKIHGMVMGELDNDLKSPHPLPLWNWLKPASYTLKRWE